jgi:hypothetical protein
MHGKLHSQRRRQYRRQQDHLQDALRQRADRVRRRLGAPRPFVEAPDFSGPDRRRNKKATPGGPERRETEPKFLTPP